MNAAGFLIALPLAFALFLALVVPVLGGLFRFGRSYVRVLREPATGLEWE